MKNVLFYIFFLISIFLFSCATKKSGCPSCMPNKKPEYYNSQQNFRKAQRDHSLRTATGEKVPTPSVENNFNQGNVGKTTKKEDKKTKKTENTPIRK